MMICMFATTLGVSVAAAQAPRVIARKLCDQLDQADADQDLNGVLGFYDSSYVGTDPHGKRVAFSELRKQLEQHYAKVRRMHPSTIVEDVHLGVDRMVVYTKTEAHYEFYDRRLGWVPMIYNASGEATWASRGGHWRLVRGTTYHLDVQTDPEWLKQKRALINCMGGCPPR
jgi:hypothetical protein